MFTTKITSMGDGQTVLKTTVFNAQCFIYNPYYCRVFTQKPLLWCFDAILIKLNKQKLKLNPIAKNLGCCENCEFNLILFI